MSTATALKQHNDMIWQPLCTRADLVENSGVAAWLETDNGPTQVALFYIPAGPTTPELSTGPTTPELSTGPTTPELSTGPTTPELSDRSHELYAVDNHDPFSGVSVIARGIVGDTKGQPVVASPLYKQHFRLSDGGCLENADVRLHHWPVRFDGDRVMIAIA